MGKPQRLKLLSLEVTNRHEWNSCPSRSCRIQAPEWLKPSLKREHLAQRWKRCSTQNQVFPHAVGRLKPRLRFVAFAARLKPRPFKARCDFWRSRDTGELRRPVRCWRVAQVPSEAQGRLFVGSRRFAYDSASSG